MEKPYINYFTHSCNDDPNASIENMQDIMVFTMVIGEKLSQPIPTFRNLTQVCLDDLNQEKSCLKIAELLIKKSKSIVSAHIGYAIKINVFKQKEDQRLQQMGKLIIKNITNVWLIL